MTESIKRIVRNKRAYHDYAIEDTIEAGMVLVGSEVKSLRLGQCTIGDAYAGFDGTELFLKHLTIAEYKQANRNNHDPQRDRKLLLHRAQLGRLMGKVQEQGLTLVPLELYFKNGRAKVLLGLAKGKKRYDKREEMKKTDARRELAGRSD